MVLLDRSKSAITAANRENSHNEAEVNISFGPLASRGLAVDLSAKAAFVW